MEDKVVERLNLMGNNLFLIHLLEEGVKNFRMIWNGHLVLYIFI
jgi:hypothetical protein